MLMAQFGPAVSTNEPAAAKSLTLYSPKFSPNFALASGGAKIQVKGWNLQGVSKIRVGGIGLTKLTNKSKTGFYFVMPKLPESTKKYGGFVNIEFFDTGVWKKVSSKMLAMARGNLEYTSGQFSFSKVETDETDKVFVTEEVWPEVYAISTSPSFMFYTVLLRVRNNSDVGVDFSCGNQMKISLYDRRFIEERGGLDDYWIYHGNPECGELKKPGSTTDVLFAFELEPNFPPVAIKISTLDRNGSSGRAFLIPFSNLAN
jgi:hypothetical protein